MIAYILVPFIVLVQKRIVIYSYQQYADQLVINDYEGSKAYSAVHYTDFVGRSPLILFRSQYTIGGNPPTGGVEDKPFMYSHNSYYREKPKDISVDEKKKY